jgi:hypothetical protein
MPNLLKTETVREMNIGISEYTSQLYPGVSFDTALPQSWVDAMANRGFDLRGQVVWGYPKEGGLYGCPLPLTEEAMMAMCLVAGHTA